MSTTFAIASRTSLKPRDVKRFERTVAKARAKNSLKAFDKLVEVVDGQPRFVGDPPRIVPLDQLFAVEEHQRVAEVLHKMLHSYRRSLHGDHRHLLGGFHFVEAALKVVGVGSVGTRAWVVLMVGNDARRPVVPAGQGGAALGAGAVPGQGPARQPRPAGRGRSTADAVRERHPARLDPGRRAGRRLRGTTTSGSCGTARDRRDVESMKPSADAGLRGAVWMDAGTCARAFR